MLIICRYAEEADQDSSEDEKNDVDAVGES